MAARYRRGAMSAFGTKADMTVCAAHVRFRGQSRHDHLRHVRFGSLADICSAIGHVRFTPNSDRKSRHAANGHVCFAPESGRVRRKPSCLLWAKSGHCAASISSSHARSCRPASISNLRTGYRHYIANNDGSSHRSSQDCSHRSSHNHRSSQDCSHRSSHDDRPAASPPRARRYVT